MFREIKDIYESLALRARLQLEQPFLPPVSGTIVFFACSECQKVGFKQGGVVFAHPALLNIRCDEIQRLYNKLIVPWLPPPCSHPEYTDSLSLTCWITVK